MKQKLYMFIVRTALCFRCARIYLVSYFLNMPQWYKIVYRVSLVLCILYLMFRSIHLYVPLFVIEVNMLYVLLLKCHSNCICGKITQLKASLNPRFGYRQTEARTFFLILILAVPFGMHIQSIFYSYQSCSHNQHVHLQDVIRLPV